MWKNLTIKSNLQLQSWLILIIWALNNFNKEFSLQKLISGLWAAYFMKFVPLQIPSKEIAFLRSVTKSDKVKSSLCLQFTRNNWIEWLNGVLQKIQKTDLLLKIYYKFQWLTYYIVKIDCQMWVKVLLRNRKKTFLYNKKFFNYNRNCFR